MAQRKLGTETAVLNTVRKSLPVVSGISAQQISKTQDSDAAEVLRRIPGITIVDDRFIVVRGLAQRYNNVWLNNATTPSSETDSRAFSFDVLPSSLIDNMMVYKSPSAEVPAEFNTAVSVPSFRWATTTTFCSWRSASDSSIRTTAS